MIAHVILVGLPGAGKSSVGRRVASRLGRPFLDFDEELERRTTMTVSEIFRTHGEQYFRGLELDLTRELAKSQGAILAPGGGWVTVPRALALLRPPARMIYLRVAPEVAILRIRKGRRRRPLLETHEPVEALRRLAEEREPAYSQADYVIDTDVVDVESLAVQIARLVDPSSGSRVQRGDGSNTHDSALATRGFTTLDFDTASPGDRPDLASQVGGEFSDPVQRTMTFRVLGPHERGRFTPDAWGHLISMSGAGMLNAMELEHVIERALSQIDGRIALDDLRVLMEGAGYMDDGLGGENVTIH